MTRGGDNRMIVRCVSLHKMPRLISCSTKGAASVLSSMPINKPRPLISLILGCLSCSNAFNKNEPKRSDRSTSCSSLSTSSAAVYIAMAKGLPPNVEPCVPGVRTRMTSLFASTADTGYKPPPNALPKI